MSKQEWKPGNMLYPLPAVMVTVCDRIGEEKKDNIITVAWVGTICTNPPMVSISLRKSRYSYEMLCHSREFVINLTTEKLAWATDFCGVRSGRDLDKFEATGLTKEEASVVGAPLIKESPVNIECQVTEIKELGSHVMFLAQVAAVHADEKYMDENKKFDLQKANPLVYSHGEYFSLGKSLGAFGYSVKKKKPRKHKGKYK